MIKGFESGYDEDKYKPIPGTDAYLRWVQEKRRIDKRKMLQDSRQAVDNPLLIDSETITPEVTVTPEVIVKQTPKKTPSTITPEVTVTPEVIEPTVTSEVIGEGYVVIQNNWFRMDNDIVGLMSRLTDPEFKIYLFMVSLSYGQWKPKNICSASLSSIAEAVGSKATPPISRNIKSLIKRGLLQRIFRGDKKGDPSIYRVFLPSEVSWFGGKTRVRLLPEK